MMTFQGERKEWGDGDTEEINFWYLGSIIFFGEDLE